MGQHFESRAEQEGFRAGFVLGGSFVHLEKIPALPEYVQEFLGLGSGYFQSISFEKDDGPGKHRKENQNEKYKFDDETCIEYQS
jgi:hypothetical protein